MDYLNYHLKSPFLKRGQYKPTISIEYQPNTFKTHRFQSHFRAVCDENKQILKHNNGVLHLQASPNKPTNVYIKADNIQAWLKHFMNGPYTVLLSKDCLYDAWGLSRNAPVETKTFQSIVDSPLVDAPYENKIQDPTLNDTISGIFTLYIHSLYSMFIFTVYIQCLYRFLL